MPQAPICSDTPEFVPASCLQLISFSLSCACILRASTIRFPRDFIAIMHLAIALGAAAQYHGLIISFSLLAAAAIHSGYKPPDRVWKYACQGRNSIPCRPFLLYFLKSPLRIGSM